MTKKVMKTMKLSASTARGHKAKKKTESTYYEQQEYKRL